MTYLMRQRLCLVDQTEVVMRELLRTDDTEILESWLTAGLMDIEIEAEQQRLLMDLFVHLALHAPGSHAVLAQRFTQKPAGRWRLAHALLTRGCTFAEDWTQWRLEDLEDLEDNDESNKAWFLQTQLLLVDVAQTQVPLHNALSVMQKPASLMTRAALDIIDKYARHAPMELQITLMVSVGVAAALMLSNPITGPSAMHLLSVLLYRDGQVHRFNQSHLLAQHPHMAQLLLTIYTVLYTAMFVLRESAAGLTRATLRVIYALHYKQGNVRDCLKHELLDMLLAMLDRASDATVEDVLVIILLDAPAAAPHLAMPVRAPRVMRAVHRALQTLQGS